MSVSRRYCDGIAEVDFFAALVAALIVDTTGVALTAQ
jgi:hypothetical protein